MPSLLPLLLLLAGCGDDPDPVALWSTDSAGAVKALRALDDPEDRELAIRAIVQKDPAASTQLCELMAGEPGQAWCERIAIRPHLWTATESTPVKHPERRRLRLPDGMMRVWDSLTPDPGDCAPTQTACLSQDATELARTGDVQEAAARCAAAKDALWRKECFFMAAEAVPRGPDEASQALSLCAAAGEFIEMCVGHVLLELRSDSLAEVAANARSLSAALNDDDNAILNLYWCQSAHNLLANHPEQLAAAWSAWPPEAARHLRSALAMAVVETPDPKAAFAAALAGATPPALVIPDDHASELMLWGRDLTGEDQIEAIPFRFTGADRRATSPDPTLDGRLALLSAMGHAQHPDIDAIALSLQDSEVLMRWTAARMLSKLAPNHPALARAATDPDPRVRTRSGSGFTPNGGVRDRSAGGATHPGGGNKARQRGQ